MTRTIKKDHGTIGDVRNDTDGKPLYNTGPFGYVIALTLGVVLGFIITLTLPWLSRHTLFMAIATLLLSTWAMWDAAHQPGTKATEFKLMNRREVVEILVGVLGFALALAALIHETQWPYKS